jgi:hypothetical protein
MQGSRSLLNWMNFMLDARHPTLSIVASSFLFACLLAGIAGCSGPASRTRGIDSGVRQPEILREDLSFPIDKGISTVEIDNRYGEINIRDHDGDKVGVHGVVQTLPPDFARARVVMSTAGEVLRLVVELPGGNAGGRYDMAAYVPNGMTLVLNGAADRVDVRRRTGPVTVTTTSGHINASSHSRLNLNTGSGTIRATPLDATWAGKTRVSSIDGQIIVLTPLSGDISVTAETGGRLSTDFGLSIRHRAGGGSAATARYGAGTGQLEVFSVSGEVILEQAVLLEQDEESAAETD